MANIVIIGSGVNALAAAIRFKKEGHEVTILESDKKSGQGVTKRFSDQAGYAICHSGIYNAKGSKKEQYCMAVRNALKSDEKNDDIVINILRENSVKMGKLIIARTEEETAKLSKISAEKKYIDHEFLQGPAAIAALDEPSLGDITKIKSAIYLPDIRAIHIQNYTAALEKKFLEMGGEIKFNHKVSGFENPQKKESGTIVKCENGASFAADIAINMAGLAAEELALQARETLITSGVSQDKLGKEPEMEYFHMYGMSYVPDDNVIAKNIIYSAENDSLNPSSSIGLHTYPSFYTEDKKFCYPVFGYLPKKISQQQALTRSAHTTAEVTLEMIKQVQEIFPNAKAENLRYVCLGDRAKLKDFCETVLQDPNPNSGFCVINSYSSDSPGLTASPVIAEEMLKLVNNLLGLQKHVIHATAASKVAQTARAKL